MIESCTRCKCLMHRLDTLLSSMTDLTSTLLQQNASGQHYNDWLKQIKDSPYKEFGNLLSHILTLYYMHSLVIKATFYFVSSLQFKLAERQLYNSYYEYIGWSNKNLKTDIIIPNIIKSSALHEKCCITFASYHELRWFLRRTFGGWAKFCFGYR